MLRNTFFQIAGRTVSGISNLVAFALLARSLDRAGFGTFAMFLVCVNIPTTAIDGALYVVSIRELSARRGSWAEVMAAILLLKLPITLLCLVTGLTLALVVGNAGLLGVMSIAMIAIVLTNLTTIALAMLAAQERMGIVGLAMIAQSILFLAGVLAISRLGTSIEGAAWIYTVSTLGGLLAAAAFVISDIPSRMRLPTWGLLREMTTSTGLVATNYAAVNTLAGLDTILLSRILGAGAVGVYAAAYRFFYMGQMPANSLAFAAYPVMSRLAHENGARVRELFQTLSDSMILIAVPIAVATPFVAQQVVLAVYGHTYAQASQPLIILMFAVGCMMFVMQVDMSLLALRQQRLAALLSALALVLNLSANLMLIPRLGVSGAAMALLVSLAAWASLGYAAVARQTRLRPRLILTLKVVAAAGMAAIAAAVFSRWPWVAQLSLFVAVYGVALLCLRARSDYRIEVLLRKGREGALQGTGQAVVT